ncbi:MAG: calcium/sodium antiporter, partial [Candidatus Kerfeldbacteria bacterium]|nr:calcium/sodium antiporter [Candidatus Kerfeldbacteria bacterium]
MWFSYLLFLIGFGLLIKGADWLVEGASALAKRLGISALVIGLTVVAFGTSMPELIVNLLASIKGNTDIAIGNIVGSNIANILLILGISAIIYPLVVTRGTVWKEIPLALLAMIAIAILANDALLDGYSFSTLGRGDGLVLMAFFIIFLYYIWSISRQESTDQTEVKERPLLAIVVMVTAGLMMLLLGGKWVIDGAVMLAGALGVSQALIGLTIVAVGTSLPELATSAVAAYKHNSDIAVGNIVGSNIFNVFWILGLSAVIKPLPLSPLLNMDVVIGVLATLLLFATMFIGHRHRLDRWQGATFVALYVFYL